MDRLTSDPEGRAAVADYLRASGLRLLESASSSPSLLTAEGTVRAWSAALHTEFFEVRRTGPGRGPRLGPGSRPDGPLLRCRRYSLPAGVARHVSSVLGTVQLPVEIRRGGPHILGAV